VLGLVVDSEGRISKVLQPGPVSQQQQRLVEHLGETHHIELREDGD